MNTGLLQRLTRSILVDLMGKPRFELAIQVVGISEIVRLNEAFLRHAGPTDVIAFDYREGDELDVHGEIFVCLPVALEQSRRYRTSWEAELVRYVVHGVLHLCGHDDSEPLVRRKMKKVENKALKDLAARFHFGKLGARRS